MINLLSFLPSLPPSIPFSFLLSFLPFPFFPFCSLCGAQGPAPLLSAPCGAQKATHCPQLRAHAYSICSPILWIHKNPVSLAPK